MLQLRLAFKRELFIGQPIKLLNQFENLLKLVHLNAHVHLVFLWITIKRLVLILMSAKKKMADVHINAQI